MKSFLRSPRGAILCLFVFALFVRIIGLTWGLPNVDRWYSYHPDEHDIAAAVFNLDFLAGQFNPHFYSYPSLFLYLTYFVHGALALLGFTHTPPEQWSVLREIIFSGRLVSAVLGAATVPLAFLLAREWFRRTELPQNERDNAGAFAGILLALLPGHIQHSHFATVDISATFLVALSLLFATRALRDQSEIRWRTKQLLLSALFAGFAAATKYNAVIVLIAPLISAWLITKSTPLFGRTFLRIAATIYVVSTGAFLIGCPGVLLAPHEFWGDGKYTGFAYELLVHPKIGHGEIFVGTGQFGWWHHLTFNLPFVMTTPLLLTALCGFTIIVVQMLRTRSFVFLPAIAFAVLFFVSLGFSQVRFMRYVFPLLPVLCACAAWLASEIAQRWKARTAIFTMTVLAMCVLFSSAVVLTELMQTDPRDQAAQLFQEDKPVSIGLVNNPWFWTPPFVKDATPPGTPPQKVAEILASNPNYDLKVTGFDAQKLAREKPDYFVMSEFEWQDKVRLKDAAFLQFAKILNQDYLFDRAFGRDVFPLLAHNHTSFPASVPHDYLYTNPQVRIYIRRSMIK